MKHHHTDAGALTILYQDDSVSSLQVYKNEKWHFIEPREGTFVINIGDMIQVWSNDVYSKFSESLSIFSCKEMRSLNSQLPQNRIEAPLHRVQANSTKERYSAPFFYNPEYRADVYPLLDNDTSASLYKTVNWGDFRAQRFAGDFADLGEEVQISNYLVDN